MAIAMVVVPVTAVRRRSMPVTTMVVMPAMMAVTMTTPMVVPVVIGAGESDRRGQQRKGKEGDTQHGFHRKVFSGAIVMPWQSRLIDDSENKAGWLNAKAYLGKFRESIH